MRKTFLFTLIWLTSWRAPAESAGTSSAAFLTMGAGPRASAMADAQVGLADDVYASYWNPAGLSNLKAREAGFVHTQHLLGIHSQYAAYAHPVARIGTFAGSLLSLHTGSFQAYDATGAPSGRASAADTAFGLSFARGLWSSKRIGGAISAGATAKWIHERLHTATAQAYAIDTGLLFAPGRIWGRYFESVQAGLALRNLGTPITFDREKAPLPTSLSAGLRWAGRWLGEPLHFTLDGQKPKEEKLSLGMGVEFSWLRLLMLRGGYSTRDDWGSGLRLGGGIRVKTLQIDYAFAPAGALGQIHRLGLTVRLGAGAVDPVVLAQNAYRQGERAYRRGQFADAIILFNKALQINTTHPDAWRRMKEAHEQLKATAL